jgi:hypothetical protein
MSSPTPDPEEWATHLRTRFYRMGLGTRRLSMIMQACLRLGNQRPEGLIIQERIQPGECGRTFFDGETWCIWRDPTETWSRQRFTLLHEFGHYLLRRDGKRVPDEERWCDRFAAEVLAPKAEVSAIVSDQDSVVANVERIMECFGVSFSVALRRMNEATGSSWRVVLYWRRDGKWVLHSTVAIHKHTATSLRSLPSTSRVLDSVDIWTTAEIDLPLRVFRREVSIPATAVRRDDFCHLVIAWNDLFYRIRVANGHQALASSER